MSESPFVKKRERTATPPALVQLHNLRKVYRTERVITIALDDVSLEVQEGEFVCVQGPSGSGKSTLLSILGLLDVPSGGRYFLAGVATESLDRWQRARLRNQYIGFIFQSFHLLPELTVEQNVELPLIYRGTPAEQRRRRVLEVLDRVSMAHRRHHYPFQLSGGEQQRVAVARALAGSPKLLLADEPTGNLDSASGKGVMELLAELHRCGSTICMVTHDPRYETYATRIVRLFDGRIIGSN